VIRAAGAGENGREEKRRASFSREVSVEAGEITSESTIFNTIQRNKIVERRKLTA